MILYSIVVCDVRQGVCVSLDTHVYCMSFYMIFWKKESRGYSV